MTVRATPAAERDDAPVPPVIHLNAPFGHELPRDLLERAVRATLEHQGAGRAEVSVTFLPDDSILDLNRRWLGHDWVPDVLSFELHEPGDPPLGDVYVGIEQAARQAGEEGVPLHEELCRLVIHGTLHVLGHEHQEGSEPAGSKEEMCRTQERLLALALGDGEGQGRFDGPGGGR